MKTFGWSLNHIRLKITSAQGWIFYAWAQENEMTVFGMNFERKTDGYIAQERKRILSKHHG